MLGTLVVRRTNIIAVRERLLPRMDVWRQLPPPAGRQALLPL